VKGKAPDQIAASRLKDGAVDRTRPLCPYPQVATYKGSGSIDEEANFVCRIW
jgi:feruloyl esterase